MHINKIRVTNCHCYKVGCVVFWSHCEKKAQLKISSGENIRSWFVALSIALKFAITEILSWREPFERDSVPSSYTSKHASIPATDDTKIRIRKKQVKKFFVRLSKIESATRFIQSTILLPKFENWFRELIFAQSTFGKDSRKVRRISLEINSPNSVLYKEVNTKGILAYIIAVMDNSAYDASFGVCLQGKWGRGGFQVRQRETNTLDCVFVDGTYQRSPLVYLSAVMKSAFEANVRCLGCVSPTISRKLLSH